MNFELVIALCFCFTLTNANHCMPLKSLGEKLVPCEKLGKPVPVGGGLVRNRKLQTINYRLRAQPVIMIMDMNYAKFRMLDALGYDKCCKNSTLLNGINLMTPWSGTHGAVAIDGIYGFHRNILRRCKFPTKTYPFLCKGSKGTEGTRGENLGTVSYISLLHDEKKHKWTLFGQCWNPKTPENPRAVPIATSFNVFSLDSKLSRADKMAIYKKLKELGFRTDNIIEPDFTGNPAPLQC